MPELTSPPSWFWKVLALAAAGSLITLMGIGSAAGQFIGETHMWIEKSDERFYKHLESDKQRADELGVVLRDVLERMVESNERSLLAVSRSEHVGERLDRVEDSLRSKKLNKDKNQDG